jgi:NADPH:quinone reductase-like Zn-dependent oxidoreductase
MREGTLKLPVEATYSFAEYERALKHDKSPRLGKILLKP